MNEHDDNIERRSLSAVSELRIHEDGGEAPKIVGYAAVFNSLSEELFGPAGRFREIVRPGAFADSLAGGADVRALVDHHPSKILWSISEGTLNVAEDKKGLRFEVDLNTDDPDAMKLFSRVKRGDISGNSFSFTIDEADEELSTRDGRRHRVITRVARLFDVGPVTFPAYDATVLTARCQAWENEEVQEDAPDFTNERECAANGRILESASAKLRTNASYPFPDAVVVHNGQRRVVFPSEIDNPRRTFRT